MSLLKINNSLVRVNISTTPSPPTPPPSSNLPKKGNIIKLNLDGTDRNYRVLNMNGNIGKVMGIFDDLMSSKFNNSSTPTTMGAITVQKYENSTVDTYLNTTWYNTLTTETKNAIVPENIMCDAWYWDDTGNPDYTGTYGTTVPGAKNYTISKYTGGTLNINNHNISILSIQDVIDYLSDGSMRVDTSAILRNVNIWKMFWNTETQQSNKYLWLRSSSPTVSRNIWFVDGDNGNMDNASCANSFIIRPVLNLDFSKFSSYHIM